jgi:multidrug efflux pump subunit AcrA (membrane-fusion protein)
MPRIVRSLIKTPRRRIIAGATVAALVLVGAGGAVYASTRSDADRYRTAVAQRADVSQTLTLTGQLAAAASRDVAFQVAGTVASVLVKLGDTVTAGQQLATLDAEALDAAVTDAEDQLAQAQRQLEDDLQTQQNGGSSTASGSSGASRPSGAAPSGGSAGSGGTPGTGPSSGDTPGGTAAPSPSPTPTAPTDGGDGGDGTDPAVTAAINAVADAQQALLTQYEQTTKAQATSSAALTAAQTVCKPFLDATLSVDQGKGTTTDADGSTADTTTSSPSSSSNADELKQQLADCQSALSATQDAQAQTTTQQSTLTDRATALDSAVAALQRALAAGTSSGGAGTGTGTGTAGSGADSTGTTPDESTPTAAPSAYTSASPATIALASVVRTTTGAQPTAALTAASADQAPSGQNAASGGSTTVTSETILADRAEIDAVEAALAVAKRDRTLATLTSPIAGEVVSVGLATGDAVSAASTDAAIRVQSSDGYVVDVSVPLAQIAGVEVGQSAKAVLAAFGAEYDGTVSSVGVQNVSTTSTPSYTVTVAVDAGDAQPRIGATTRLTITLAAAKDVLTVPISAVTRSGGSATVTVLSGDATKTVAVKLGAVGSERVEITDGLSAGDRVVLADLTKSVLDEDSSSSTGLSGLGGSTSNRGDFQPPAGFQPPSG